MFWRKKIQCPHCLRRVLAAKVESEFPGPGYCGRLCEGCKQWFIVNQQHAIDIPDSDQTMSYLLPPMRDDAAFHSIRNVVNQQ